MLLQAGEVLLNVRDLAAFGFSFLCQLLLEFFEGIGVSGQVGHDWSGGDGSGLWYKDKEGPIL